MEIQEKTEVDVLTPSDRFSERRLGELLCSRGVTNQEVVDAALEVQGERGGLLGEILVGQRSITERQLLEALGVLAGTICDHGQLAIAAVDFRDQQQVCDAA